jgi:hypothetical protein
LLVSIYLIPLPPFSQERRGELNNILFLSPSLTGGGVGERPIENKKSMDIEINIII